MILVATDVPADLSAWLIGTPVTVLAFLVIAFIQGWVVPGRTHQRALDRNDKQAAEIRELHGMVTETMAQVLPTLTRTTDLLTRAANRQRGA